MFFSHAVIMGPLWQTFVSALEVYLQSSTEGQEDPYQGRYDSDGAEKSLDSFIIQVNCLSMCNCFWIIVLAQHLCSFKNSSSTSDAWIFSIILLTFTSLDVSMS